MDREKIDNFERSNLKNYLFLALGVPLFSLIIISTLQVIYTNEFYQSGLWLFYLTTPLSIIIGVAFAKNLLKTKPNKTMLLLHIILFHILFAAIFILAMPVHTGYAFIWVLLVYGSYISISYKAAMVSYFALIAVEIITLVYRDMLNDSQVLLAAIEVILIFAISQLIINQSSLQKSELSELKNSLNRELYERQRLLSLINNMGDGVIATDKRGKILLYNAAALDLLDTNETLEGKQIDKIIHLVNQKNRRIKLATHIKDTTTNFTTRDYRHKFSQDDYINLYINLSSIKIGFKQGVDSGYIVIFRDITKEKSLEEERDEFISVISHELRTPIAIAEGNISNAIFMVDADKEKRATQQSLHQAHDQVVFLARMINDLATLSRAERTDVPIEVTKVNPADVIADLNQDYQPEAKAKGLKLTASSAKDVRTINTSDLYLHEVLQNFVTNAIKYTKKGSVMVHVRSNKKGDAVFSVSDTGIGLSKSDQKRVFDKFFRSEDYRTRESGGTGLGLYVTAKLANRLRANITLESQINKGSTFTITVPSFDKTGVKKT